MTIRLREQLGTLLDGTVDTEYERIRLNISGVDTFPGHEVIEYYSLSDLDGVEDELHMDLSGEANHGRRVTAWTRNWVIFSTEYKDGELLFEKVPRDPTPNTRVGGDVAGERKTNGSELSDVFADGDRKP